MRKINVESMKIWEKIKKQKPHRIIGGVLIGAVLGYAYYYFVGCNSGTCAITSNPINSVLYGSFAGLVISFK